MKVEQCGVQRKSRISAALRARCTLLPVLCCCAAGCSNQQVYNAIQESQRVDCQQYPDTRYEECMQQLDKSYQDYEEEREALEGE
jgi:hypothetical protein